MENKNDKKTDLTELRNSIDEVDGKILDLLNKRAEFVLEVGKVKEKQGSAFYVPSREQNLLRKLEEKNSGPFPTSAIKPVWKEIISASLSLERPIEVAYLGPKATFTHQACQKQFGLSARFRPVRTIAEVFDIVEKNKVNYGVIPIENSTEGVVSYTLDMFVESDLKIVAEILLGITHDFLNLSGKAEDVERIYSHPHAVAQCRRWLEEHFPDVPAQDASSTAEAAKIAAEDPTAAAVAGELAGAIYGLKAVETRIEDNPNNFTRFLVIGKNIQSHKGGADDKTSLLFAVKDEVGALYRMLQPFYDNGVSLTKIESRPMKQKAWEYVFFVDCEGHVSDEKVAATLDQLRGQCKFLKVLGSYPRAKNQA